MYIGLGFQHTDFCNFGHYLYPCKAHGIKHELLKPLLDKVVISYLRFFHSLQFERIITVDYFNMLLVLKLYCQSNCRNLGTTATEAGQENTIRQPKA